MYNYVSGIIINEIVRWGSMSPKGRVGWIIGVGIMSLICILTVSISTVSVAGLFSDDNETLSVEEVSAYCYRASELYCAGVYYTDLALSANPEQMTYGVWSENLEQAEIYWDALDRVLDIIEETASSDAFIDSIDDMETKSHIFSNTAYAYDSAELMRVYDGAQTGKELEAVAKYIGRDVKYATSAMKVAKGEITSEKWDNYGDTMLALETAARGVKTVAQGAFLVVGAPAAGTAALSAGGAMYAVGGASWLLQLVDDGCFIVMGDRYDNNEFVADLGTVKDVYSSITFVNDMLSLDFSNLKDGVMSAYTYGETFRSALQDGKIAGIQMKGPSGKLTTMTSSEYETYKKAKEDGEKLPAEIDALLAILKGEPEEIDEVNVELDKIKVEADKDKVLVEEWVHFDAEKPEYGHTYVWKYGSNENPQETNSFKYMYQVAGVYVMTVTVLDEKGTAIAEGSCKVTVEELPEEDVINREDNDNGLDTTDYDDNNEVGDGDELDATDYVDNNEVGDVDEPEEIIYQLSGLYSWESDGASWNYEFYEDGTYFHYSISPKYGKSTGNEGTYTIKATPNNEAARGEVVSIRVSHITGYALFATKFSDTMITEFYEASTVFSK